MDHLPRRRGNGRLARRPAETVERWLGEADPDEELGQTARVRELTWPGGGIRVTLRAIPRSLASRRTVELVGNPFPAIAYWTGGS